MNSLPKLEGSISILDGTITIPYSYIYNQVHAEKGDIILVSGTLIEGIGNIHSDLDIYVIVENLPKASLFNIESHVAVCNEDDDILGNGDNDIEVGSTYDYYGDSGLHIDIKYTTFAEVYEIYDTIRSDFSNTRIDDKLYYPTTRNNLSKEQEKFLHRLQHGIVLSNIEDYEELKNSCPTSEYCFLLFRQFSPNYFTFKNIQGSWVSGQLPMSREIARGLVMMHMQSITHLNQNTNKTSKWIFEYVAQLPDWAEDAKNSFCSLMSIGARESKDIRTYILDAMDTMDIIFKTGVKLMQMQSGYPTPEECMEHLDIAFGLRNQGDHLLSQHAYIFRAKNFSIADTPLRNLVDIDNS